MLYLINQTNTNAYKIGYAKDIKNRMTAYQTYIAYFNLIGIKEGERIDEKDYHQRLNKYRINSREWFKLTDEVLEEIVKEFDDEVWDMTISEIVDYIESLI